MNKSPFRLRPSSSHKWMLCSASPSMEASVPTPPPHPTAIEGNAAHWVGEQVLRSWNSMSYEINEPHQLVDKAAPNGTIIDAAMADFVLDYIEEVQAGAQAVGGMGNLHIEELVHVSTIHPELEGTPDCWLFDPGTGVLIVWDLKYGWRLVNVLSNWQLIIYTLGVILALAQKGHRVKHVNVVVVQPRPFHVDGRVRTWSISMPELIELGDQVKAQVDLIYSGKTQCVTGHHCGDCDALHACPSGRAAALASVDITGRAVLNTLGPKELGIEVALLRRAKQMIIDRLDAMELQTVAAIRNGDIVPLWKLDRTFSRKKWKVSNEELRTMCELMGIDVFKESQPMTPTQAIKSGIDEGVINAYAHSPETGVKLVPDDGRKAQEIFSK